MKLFKSLFKSAISDRPEDYSRIYFRWDREGKEYGPLWFDDMITRKWSSSPIEGRFENESKWRNYSYFQNILDCLKISQRQIDEMTKLGITNIDNNMSFKDAVNLIKLKNEELRKQREKERKAKDMMPATKQTIKKLIDLGIEFEDNITRGKAKELIAYHKDKEYIAEIFNFLEKNNFYFVKQLSIDLIAKGEDDNMPTFDQLDELYEILQTLADFKIEYNFPNTINKNELDILINKITDAQFEAEDIEDQLKEREIFLDDTEFKIVGKLPKNQLKKIRIHIINKYLRGEWNTERDLKNVIKTFLPDIILKEIEY